MNRFGWAAYITAMAIVFAAMSHATESDATNGDLICSDESMTGYQRIAVLAGRMIVSPVPKPGSPEQHRLIHENFRSLSLEDDRTYFIVAHKPTGELFTSNCASETCSFDEVSEPSMQCEMMHYRDWGMDVSACMFFAVRFRGEKFCLQQPTTAQ